jgi:hypothetical protein
VICTMKPSLLQMNRQWVTDIGADGLAAAGADSPPRGPVQRGSACADRVKGG